MGNKSKLGPKNKDARGKASPILSSPHCWKSTSLQVPDFKEGILLLPSSFWKKVQKQQVWKAAKPIGSDGQKVKGVSEMEEGGEK